MYDGLYDLFAGRGIDVVVHEDHPTLNRVAADMLAAGERIDVLSTHSKYAPSQARLLRPLDDLIDPSVLGPLAPRAVDLCRFEARLMCVPRNIDVRVLWARTDLVASVPHTWEELVDSDAVFGFPGRESGLFGTFFEIVTALGGRLFEDDGAPCMRSAEAVAAVEMLQVLAARAPSDLPDWHYDQADAALTEGRVALAATWPGGYAALRHSPFYPKLAVRPYLSGPAGWFSYGGCHAWAIPTTCDDVEGALKLLADLACEEAQRLDAASGSVPAHTDVLASVEPHDKLDEERLAITRRTIAEAMITYPPHASFPEVEDVGWHALHEALTGRLSALEAVVAVQQQAERVLI